VERGRQSSTIGFNFANSLLAGGTPTHRNSGNSVYSDFDVQRWSKSECRIVLCEAQKSQLNILILFEVRLGIFLKLPPVLSQTNSSTNKQSR
jgi:hypothetical protein